MEIGNNAVLFSELNRDKVSGRGAHPRLNPQPQKSKDGIVALAPETIALGLPQQRAAPVGGQPVPQSDADPAHAFDSANAGRKLWIE